MMIKPSMHNYEECRSYIKRLSDIASLEIEYKYVYLHVCITTYNSPIPITNMKFAIEDK